MGSRRETNASQKNMRTQSSCPKLSEQDEVLAMPMAMVAKMSEKNIIKMSERTLNRFIATDKWTM